MVKIGNLEIGNFPLLLAPMEDVSDPPFRRLCKRYGADVLCTEFISSEGLLRHAIKSVRKLDIFAYERPIGIQLFGNNIDSMREAARIAQAVQPDFIDINYGCPVKKVACKGAGAGILLDLPKMQAMTTEIVQAVQVPVTVKTRLGWDDKSIRIVEAALRLQDAGIQAISIHARTRKQMYKGDADWSYIAQVCDHPDIEIPVFGNGDIDSPAKALQYKQQYGVSGIMIGRAAIGNPWIFEQTKHLLTTGKPLPLPNLEETVNGMQTHLDLSIQWKGLKTAIHEMRPHYGRYIQGIQHAKQWRMRLMEAQSAAALHEIFEQLRHTQPQPV